MDSTSSNYSSGINPSLLNSAPSQQGKSAAQIQKKPTVESRPDNRFSVASYNIDTNILRAEEGYARTSHPEWRANSRAPLIAQTVNQLIDTKHPDIFQFQEGRKFQTRFGDVVDSVTPLLETLKQRGYATLVKPYNETGEKAFQYITGYDPAKLAPRRSYGKYLTRTPDAPTKRPDAIENIKHNNFGSEWERCVSIVEFERTGSQETVYAINAHLDIPEQARLASTALVAQFAKEIAEKDPAAKIVITGDFNTFPDRKGPEQLEIMKTATLGEAKLLTEATQDLKLPSNEKAAFSFIAFPYDFIGLAKDLDLASMIQKLSIEEHRDTATAALAEVDKTDPNFVYRFLDKLQPAQCRKEMIGLLYETCPSLGGVLDRVFHRGFEGSVECELIPASQYPSPAIASFNDEQQVKQYIVSHHQDGPAFSSDHQPVLTTFKA